MQVEHVTLVGLFIGLGFKNAKRWTPEKCQQEIANLPMTDLSDAELDAEQEKLFHALCECVNDEEEISISSDPTDSKTRKKTVAKKKTPVKKTPVKKTVTKKKAPAAKATKGTKKKAAPKAAPKKGPGVIATIQAFVEKATAKKPVTKADILEHLTAEFPDRDPAAMAKTVNVQVPTRLNKEKDLRITKNENGYFVA